jgi:signal transduction histidine kinase
MPKILICDNDNESRIALKEILHESKYNFITVNSADEVLTAAVRENPDLIILSDTLPDTNGLEILDRIKKDEKIKSIPVIITTASKDEKIKSEIFKLGACDYLSKPVNFSEAETKITVYLKLKQSQDKLAEFDDAISKTHEALIENSKLAAIGNLAAGIAHEFNNVLFIMSGYIQMYEKSSDIEEHKKIAGIFKELIKRGKSIIDSMTNFTTTDQQYSEIDLPKVIEQNLFLLGRQIEEGQVTVEKNFSQIPQLYGYKDQISQVFLNIMLNAIESMKVSSDKLLHINLVSCKSKYNFCQIDKSRDCFKSENGCIMAEIKDTGIGVAQHIKEVLFNPFVTTKGVLGGGSSSAPGKGLGLFVSYGIVKRHGGFIDVKSTGKSGTTVTVVLPCKSKN